MIISKNEYLVKKCIDHNFFHILLRKYYVRLFFINGRVRLKRGVPRIFLFRELFMGVVLKLV